MRALVANATTAGDRRAPSVLLVEDERSIAEPFARALARNGFRALIASTGRDALAIRRDADPDIVLLDLALPDIDGRDLARQLRSESEIPIIMVTARGTVTDRIVGLELGADDYIVKPFATDEAISRIRAVLRRSARTAGAGAHQSQPEPAESEQPSELTAGELRVDLASRRAWLAGAELALTRKELDLLARLMRDAGTVVTRETLISDVWDVNWFGSTKTLDVHIASLRRKLSDDPGSPTYIHTVRGVGFRFASPEERRA